MVDDIRPPAFEDQNKQTETPDQPTTTQQTSGLSRSSEDGFVVVPEHVSMPIAHNPFSWLTNMSKKKKIIIATVAFIVLIGGGGGAYAFVLNKPAPDAPKAQAVQPATPSPVEPPKPTTEASRLTGVQISPELNKRPVTSIQIENSPDARPQSGLKDAGVVFEAIAEGGITRFNASFLEAQPDYIGPIRSVRPYYAVLAAPFDPIFVHAGGSADGLAKIRSLGLKDMDHGANGGAFQRVSDRYAPHNLYSSMAALDKASGGRGYTTSEVKSFTRKAEKKGQTPTASTINMTISSALYNTSYTYDAATNTYKRNLAGQPHTDHKSGVQLSPNVLVAMSVPYSQNGIYSVYGVVGSGSVTIFQDGQVTKGTWTKATEKEQIVFKDVAGQIIGLNPGQTWITLLKNNSQVTYTP